MKAKPLKKKSKTDWDKLHNMSDTDIDYSDIPPLDNGFFKKGEDAETSSMRKVFEETIPKIADRADAGDGKIKLRQLATELPEVRQQEAPHAAVDVQPQVAAHR